MTGQIVQPTPLGGASACFDVWNDACTMSAAMGKDDAGLPFQPAQFKLTIGSLDDSDLTVQAHYNPHELQIDKSIPWGEHDERDNKNKSKPKDGQDSLEYNGAPTRTMSIDLLFDGYEQRRSVKPAIEKLEKMSTLRDSTSTEAEFRRPHFCVVVWGREIPSFRCVIEGLVVKYTMFDTRGLPLRAVCTLKLKEARLKCGPAEGSYKTIFQRANAPVKPGDFDLE